jgi:HNH endonuclease
MIVINEDILQYFRGRRRCELCDRAIPEGESAHPHHAQQRGIGGGSRLDVALNLLAACWDCHGDLHTRAGKDASVEVIAYREGLLPEQVQEAIWRLMRRPKGERRLAGVPPP